MILKRCLFKGDEDSAVKHRVTYGNVYRSYFSVMTGMDGVFHLHGFKHHDRVRCLHCISDLYGNAHHYSGQRSLDLERTGGGSGLGNHLGARIGARCGRGTWFGYNGDRFVGFL